MQGADGVGCIRACARVAAARQPSNDKGSKHSEAREYNRLPCRVAASSADHCSRNRCESSAAMQPVPALVMA
jgi:hypothetical protein